MAPQFGALRLQDSLGLCGPRGASASISKNLLNSRRPAAHGTGRGTPCRPRRRPHRVAAGVDPDWAPPPPNLSWDEHTTDSSDDSDVDLFPEEVSTHLPLPLPTTPAMEQPCTASR